MTDRYHQIMDAVQLSAESRQRILQNVSRPKARGIPLRWLSAAACLLVCLGLGLSVFGQTLHPAPTPPPVRRPNRVTGTAGIESAASAAELSALVGFSVQEPDSLPFVPAGTEYLAFHHSLAQITWTGPEESLILRQAMGAEDCSGDSTPYAENTIVTVCDVKITLQGEAAEQYTLATWTTADQSFAVRASLPRNAAEWAQLLTAFSGT